MAATGELKMMARLKPLEAERRILAAMRASKGNLTLAAEKLEMGRNTLWTIVLELGLKEKFAELWPERSRGGQAMQRGA